MNKAILPAIFLALSVTACSESVPKCSDTETTDLVKEIADEEMINQVGSSLAKLFSYELGAIRTTNTNQQTGAYECAAELSITASSTNEVTTAPISYTVELTDNQEEFYVTVYGL